jgi:hypothetical protein
MMKHVLLYLAVFTIITANANERSLENQELHTLDYAYYQPIQFKVQGLIFYVFKNGEFDIKEHSYRNRRRDMYSRYGNTSYRIRNGHHTQRPRSRKGVHFQYDHYGRLRRVGNVSLNYDAFGRIRRIGNIMVRYRSGRLSQVGGKHLVYTRRGHLIRTVGCVKPNRNCGYNTANVVRNYNQSHPRLKSNRWDWNSQNNHNHSFE